MSLAVKENFNFESYNSLPAVEASEEALNASNKKKECIAKIEEYIHSNELEDIFGLWLVHSHFEIKADEIVVESSHLLKGEGMELVSESRKVSDVDMGSLAPHRFQVIEGSTELESLEYTDDVLTQKTWDWVQENPEYLNAIAKIIEEARLTKVLGIALLGERCLMSIQSGTTVFQEQTEDDSKNISSLVERNGDTEKNIETTWAFKKGQSDVIATYVCFRVCIRRSPGHSVSHRRTNCTRYV